MEYQAAAFKVTVAAHQAPAHQTTLERHKSVSTIAPAVNPTFASVTARPGPTLKCDQCRSSFKNDSDLKIHIEATHKMSLSSPATGMHLYKTMFYNLKDPISFNAPPPPDCKSCKKQGSLFVILPPPGRQLKIRVFSLSPTEKSVFPKPATVY